LQGRDTGSSSDAAFLFLALKKSRNPIEAGMITMMSKINRNSPGFELPAFARDMPKKKEATSHRIKAVVFIFYLRRFIQFVLL